MNILILGNGFDLAHGLKTKYSDFIYFCNDHINNLINLTDNKLNEELSRRMQYDR
jgi:hypothetical protein